MNHMNYIIEKGQAPCLWRGFESLRKKSGIVDKNTVSVYGLSPRRMKLIPVYCYDEFAQKPKNSWEVTGHYKYKYIGEYYADVVTGALFDPNTGECLSSSQLRMVV